MCEFHSFSLLLLISSFLSFPLQMEKILDVISAVLNLFGLILWPYIRSVYKHVLRGREKDACPPAGWNVLHGSRRSVRPVVLFSLCLRINSLSR